MCRTQNIDTAKGDGECGSLISDSLRASQQAGPQENWKQVSAQKPVNGYSWKYSWQTPNTTNPRIADEDNVDGQGSEILFENEKEHFPAPYSIQEPGLRRDKEGDRNILKLVVMVVV